MRKLEDVPVESLALCDKVHIKTGQKQLHGFLPSKHVYAWEMLVLKIRMAKKNSLHSKYIYENA